MTSYRIAVIVGSLRRESLNRQLVNAVIRLMPSNFVATQVPIGDLPPVQPGRRRQAR